MLKAVLDPTWLVGVTKLVCNAVINSVAVEPESDTNSSADPDDSRPSTPPEAVVNELKHESSEVSVSKTDKIGTSDVDVDPEPLVCDPITSNTEETEETEETERKTSRILAQNDRPKCHENEENNQSFSAAQAPQMSHDCNEFYESCESCECPASLGNGKYHFLRKIRDTSQGTVGLYLDKLTQQHVAIKRADKLLHFRNQTKDKLSCDENIIAESNNLQLIWTNSSKDVNDNIAHVANVCNIGDTCKLSSTSDTSENVPKSIIKYVDFFEDENNFYFVQEYGGCSMLEHVNKAPQTLAVLSDQEGNRLNSQKSQKSQKSQQIWSKHACICIGQMARALYFLHEEKNMTHGDLSLENCLIQLDGDDMMRPQVKLIDFGLSRVYTTHEKDLIAQRVEYELCDRYAGKLEYMSPETVACKPYDPFLNDVWCFGVCVYAMFARRVPFEIAKDCDDNFKRVMSGDMDAVLKENGLHGWFPLQAVNLLKLILRNEKERCTMKEVIKHPLIVQAHEWEKESLCSDVSDVNAKSLDGLDEKRQKQMVKSEGELAARF